jgi:hypothetical protein
MSYKVCKICGKTQSVTDPTLSLVKLKENDADGPGERQIEEKFITVNPQNDKEILQTPPKPNEELDPNLVKNFYT